MRYLIEKITKKLICAGADIRMTAGMLRCSANTQDTASSAITYLQSVSPDLGKSCWIEHKPGYENRKMLLSVIVPAYNVEKYIDNCLTSILQQQISLDYEVIVVNDGSTDATPALLEKYEQIPRICIIHQENAGLAAARNTGIAHARGEYLCFVDSDDDLPAGSLEALMHSAMQNDAKLVSGSYGKYLRNGRVQSLNMQEDKKADNVLLSGFAWGKVIHYSVFQNLRFPEGYWFEDSVMAQIVHPMCQDSTYTTSHLCYCYYSNEAGITATAKGNPKSLDSLWITMRLLKEREKFGLAYSQASYSYFLLMTRLTYQRTKYLGAQVAQCIFVVQRMLMDRYYSGYQIVDDRKKQQIQDALRTNNFRKYILACEQWL